jgi:hypothetical protein
MCDTHDVRRPGVVLVLAVALLAVAAGAARADDPAEDPRAIFKAARAAMAKSQFELSPLAGFTHLRTPYQEAPAQGGILIGFELGLGPFFQRDFIYALRPIYLTERGEVYGREYGLFTGERSKVKKRVRVKAKAGYAVSGFTARPGLFIDGMSVAYMRIRGTGLDPLDTYSSAWVGSTEAGGRTTVSGGGSPVVGIFGNSDDQCVLALGLIFCRAIAEGQLGGPAPLQKAAAAKKGDPEGGPAPLAGKKKAAANAKKANAAPAQVEEAPPPRRNTLLPILLVLGFTVPIVLVLVLFFMHKRPARVEEPPKDEVRAARAIAERFSPAPPEKTAEGVKSAASPASANEQRPPQLPARPADDPEIPLPVLPAPRLPADGIRANRPPVVAPRPPMNPTFAPPVSGDRRACCSSCRHRFSGAEALPPWCPRCGADLKKGPAVDLPAATAAPALAQALPARPENRQGSVGLAAEAKVTLPEQPPHFCGVAEFTWTANRHYRIYFLPRELLFLEIPPPANERPPQHPWLFHFGLVGGLIAASISLATSKDHTRKIAARKDELDWSDTRELVRLAEEEPHSFRAGPEDLWNVAIKAPSFWRRLFSNCPTALLCFRHRARGSYTVQLRTQSDLRAALEHFVRQEHVLQGRGTELRVDAAFERLRQRVEQQANEGSQGTAGAV